VSGEAKPLLDLLYEHLPLAGAEAGLVLLRDGGGAPIHEEWYEDVAFLLPPGNGCANMYLSFAGRPALGDERRSSLRGFPVSRPAGPTACEGVRIG